MTHIRIAGLAMVVFVVAGVFGPAHAAADVATCSLLKSTDLEAALRQKVTQTGIDASGVPGGGPWKGVRQYVCDWWIGAKPLDDRATYVTLTVFARPARTPEEMGALSQLRSGSAVQTVKITGGDCRTYKTKGGQTPISCYADAKGRGVVLDVIPPGSVPAAQVTPLVDKAVSRLP